METWEMLKDTPLFSHLKESQLKAISLRFKEEWVDGGDLIFSEGSKADSFYIIKSGSCDVVSGGRPLASLKKGDCFGEMALLTEQERAATVRAVVDTELLSLSKSDFDSILKEDSKLETSLTHILKERLYRSYTKKHISQKKPSVIVTIESKASLKKAILKKLPKILGKRIVVVQPEPFQMEGIEAIQKDITVLSKRESASLIVPLTERFDYIIIRSYESKQDGLKGATELADAVFSTGLNWERVARCARTKAGIGIGIGLGGDLAWGLGALGFFSVWEEKRLPCDLISATGSSAIVGALVAMGLSVEEIRRALSSLTKEIFFSQSRLSKWLDGLFGKTTLSNLPIPLYISVTDLNSQDRVVLEDGSLSEAVLSTLSIPGIFKPLIKGEQLLADGRLVDPTGEKILFEKGASLSVTIEPIGKPKDSFVSKKEAILRARWMLLHREKPEFFRRFLIEFSPKELSWACFSKLERIEEIAASATASILPEISDLLP
ncbi:MAG: cyclic nucleotide-binding and patatin-like phospholipase domain-containing protein [bacterium]|nr:cyclic nucleotide-binding and patatin-like phospholipase domain-containing protein [bacterium]